MSPTRDGFVKHLAALGSQIERVGKIIGKHITAV
jgi:hypothetical protein